MSEVQFQLSLFGEHIGFQTFADAVGGLEDVLEDAESALIPESKARHWYFESEAPVQITATPNGASEAELRSVVAAIRDGIEALSQQGAQDAAWPSSLGGQARRGLTRILGVLRDPTVDLIEVTGTGIETFSVQEIQPGRGPKKNFYQDYSAIEGVLDSVSVRGRPRFTVRQAWTGRIVPGYFDIRMLDRVTAAVSKWVDVEGLVRFRDDGSVVSMSETRRIRVDDRTPLNMLEFEGALPDLTGGLSSEEYVRRLRGGVDE